MNRVSCRPPAGGGSTGQQRQHCGSSRTCSLFEPAVGPVCTGSVWHGSHATMKSFEPGGLPGWGARLYSPRCAVSPADAVTVPTVRVLFLPHPAVLLRSTSNQLTPVGAVAAAAGRAEMVAAGAPAGGGRTIAVCRSVLSVCPHRPDVQRHTYSTVPSACEIASEDACCAPYVGACNLSGPTAA